MKHLKSVARVVRAQSADLPENARRTKPRSLEKGKLLDDIPIIYEDEEEEQEGDMSESNRHVETTFMLQPCLRAFMRDNRPRLQVFGNIKCIYRRGPRHPKKRTRPNFSADIMIVDPPEPLPRDIASYIIDQHGPTPLTTIEVLSKKTAGKWDKQEKSKIDARLRVPEYILVDPTGKFLKKKLVLRRLQSNGRYKEEQDPDGGVTSALGFRLILDENSDLVLMDARTGKRYVRPLEAEAVAEALAQRARAAEEQMLALQAELARLRETTGKKSET